MCRRPHGPRRTIHLECRRHQPRANEVTGSLRHHSSVNESGFIRHAPRQEAEPQSQCGSVELRENRTQSGLRITLHPGAGEQDPFAPGGVAITLGERGAGETLEVVVVSVSENSEAERAGMLPGDVVIAINDDEPHSMQEARAKLSGPLQSDVVLSVRRGGAVQKLSVLREAVRK